MSQKLWCFTRHPSRAPKFISWSWRLWNFSFWPTLSRNTFEWQLHILDCLIGNSVSQPAHYRHGHKYETKASVIKIFHNWHLTFSNFSCYWHRIFLRTMNQDEARETSTTVLMKTHLSTLSTHRFSGTSRDHRRHRKIVEKNLEISDIWREINILVNTHQKKFGIIYLNFFGWSR